MIRGCGLGSSFPRENADPGKTSAHEAHENNVHETNAIPKNPFAIRVGGAYSLGS